ncbi:hypothetical protein [Raineyella sp.]|uniref:hypothetical protein n=1 Tax=Raineyella sp. TaxID=1911550 RepID=UPI002B21F3FD|nr:hypothetical protein [Raineyella sp.]
MAIAGGVQIVHARSQIGRHEERYENRHADHLAQVECTNEALRTFGQTQERARRDVILRMVDFLKRNAKKVKVSEQLIVDGLEASITRVLSTAKLDPDVTGWIQGFVNSAVAGGGAAVGIGAAVTEFGKASTGTAISALRGAAAEKAKLAFLGGGSLAAGGGGMRLGAITRNSVVAGSALFVAGLAVKNRGTKASTEAHEFLTEVDVAIAQLDQRDQLLCGVQERSRELDGILARLAAQATEAIDLLESEPLDMERHAGRLQASLVLVNSVREVATTPVADEDGNLDVNSDHLVFKYRNADSEAAND